MQTGLLDISAEPNRLVALRESGEALRLRKQQEMQ